MGMLNIFRRADINSGVEAYRAEPLALLLDVRTVAEYASGHIPGSKNLPLHTLDKDPLLVDNRTVPIYVYCQSGMRSRQAAAILESMGYNVKDLGGISAWRGKVEYSI